MKKMISSLFKVIFLLAVTVAAFTSCEKNNDTDITPGKLEFSFVADEMQDILKSAVMDTDSVSEMNYHLLISVMNEDSMLVLDKEVIPLYKFGNQFISQKIELDKGGYMLSMFMVINPQGDVIYAAPKEGSRLAHLVKRPLPMYFKIVPGVTSKIPVEVIPVRNQPPEEFGYASFVLNVVRPLTFYTAVYINNPLIMAPSSYVPARLKIFDPGGWGYKFNVEAKVNKLVVKGMDGNYIFVVTLENGMEYKFRFPVERLKASTLDNPLLLTIENLPGVYEKVFKTTPDNTADAMITDLNSSENFGKHPYFEASFISEPILTVMRTKRSLMFMDFQRELPKSATIKKVELILHAVRNIYSVEDSISSLIAPPESYGGFLKHIVEPWQEHEVTWTNQPKTSDINMVKIDYMPWISSNRYVYDITNLYVPEKEIAIRSFGFLFEHGTEQMPGGMIFASSDYNEEGMRPMFKVYYTLPK